MRFYKMVNIFSNMRSTFGVLLDSKIKIFHGAFSFIVSANSMWEAFLGPWVCQSVNQRHQCRCQDMASGTTLYIHGRKYSTKHQYSHFDIPDFYKRQLFGLWTLGHKIHSKNAQNLSRNSAYFFVLLIAKVIFIDKFRNKRV